MLEPKYKTAGLPKGAWIDPAARTLKWKVAGAEGDTLAFSFAALSGDRCVTAGMVVHIKDNEATRLAQATWIARGESAGGEMVSSGYSWNNSPDFREFARKVRCGYAPPPIFRDADGDGLSDAVFFLPTAGGGTPSETSVWLRRGDTFANVGRAKGNPAHAADGTTFVVDTTSAGTGYPCSLGVKIHQVFKNRVQLVVDESTEASPVNDSCAPGDGITIDLTGKDFIGFTDQATPPGGKPRKRVWRWDGKRFVRSP